MSQNIPVVSFVSLKGGVGKTTMAVATAVELTKMDIRTRLADLDKGQDSATDWYKDRTRHGYEPDVSVVIYKDQQAALRDVAGYDALVFDGPAKASPDTLSIARASTLLIHPVQPSLMDMRPAIRLFNELTQKGGVDRNRLRFLLTRVGSEFEASSARQWLMDAGYKVIPDYIPDRPSFRSTMDIGKAVTEIQFPSLRSAAIKVVKTIIDDLTAAYSQTAGEAA